MITFPGCKINLGLRVTARRDDGFHDLESVFYPVPFRDVLEILPSGDQHCTLELSGIPLPGKTEDNLCVKAWRLLRDEYGIPGVRMYLHKVIPPGSGLGGGSSDAAFALKLLSEMFGLGTDPDRLENYAGRLGSDCPFFIRNKPVMATGRGDRFAAADVSLAGMWLALLLPGIHVQTAEAFRGVSPGRPEYPVSEVVRQPPGEWKEKLVNDFERTIFAVHPELAVLKERLYASGALYASMSGSGSAVYGIFSSDPGPAVLYPGCRQVILPCAR